jgi:acyl-CoA synthetase (AMP-forming)/AMP-acid ligase II
MQTPPDADGASQKLRALACIGAMVSVDEVHAFRKGLTPNLYVSYSSTECGGLALLGPGDPPGDGYVPYAETDLTIVDGTGKAMPTGQVGSIRVRVPWMPTAYVGNPEASARRFRDGWFYPGDAGKLDARGRLFVHGRDDGAINYGGAKVMPEEVEAVLMRCPGVVDAVVTSMADSMAGDIPLAFVVLLPPTTLEAVKAFCAERIDAASIPVAILSVERMPRSGDGKVERARLQEYAQAHIVHST